MDADASFENEPGILFDGLVIPGGAASAATLAADGRVAEHVKDQYRHGKTVMAIGEARAIFDACGIVAKDDPGVLTMSKLDSGGASKFIAALARHRHPERETDPPVV